MRIISGIYGRRRFDVPSSFSARPTTDFAKENLFNVINNLTDLEGIDALDLFAGTGSISFELLSRECKSVTAVEKNNAHASFIAKVAKELKTDSLHLIRGDVFRYLHSAPKQGFDFIFADPPYALKELPEVPVLPPTINSFDKSSFSAVTSTFKFDLKCSNFFIYCFPFFFDRIS